ncbi:hypothetical protein K7X08_018103 [Anisodus acutangulus]|uniref:Uncharacterized protein n=1 Tax=Anisodus acutangulus TaxID=402998 RepID=A0A9Q1R8T7_9SOLA|nr:hypothetical protein K7X08_018103 [Anisodus acutangulus]
MWALQEFLSLPDLLEEATNYIKKLQIDLERMGQRKESLTACVNSNSKSSSTGRKERLPLPHIEIHRFDSALEVVLITGLDYQFMFNNIIRILHEEGADIVKVQVIASLVRPPSILYTQRWEASAMSSRYGAAARISEKLKQFVGAAAS